MRRVRRVLGVRAARRARGALSLRGRDFRDEPVPSPSIHGDNPHRLVHVVVGRELKRPERGLQGDALE